MTLLSHVGLTIVALQIMFAYIVGFQPGGKLPKLGKWAVFYWCYKHNTFY